MTEPNWIPVRRHPPSITDEVLRRSDKVLIRMASPDEVFVYLGYYHDDSEDPEYEPWWSLDGPDSCHLYNVTHWAEAPKGELNGHD